MPPVVPPFAGGDGPYVLPRFHIAGNEWTKNAASPVVSGATLSFAFSNKQNLMYETIN